MTLHVRKYIHTLLNNSTIALSCDFVTNYYLMLPRLAAILNLPSSHPIWHPSFQNMYQHEHSAIPRCYQYVFPHVKPPWQVLNHFHPWLQTCGMHCRIIFRPFQLFLLSEEPSNIICSSLLTLTVVQNLARPNQLNASHLVMQRQLLPSYSLEIPCRPAKCVPSERLRLVKAIHFA